MGDQSPSYVLGLDTATPIQSIGVLEGDSALDDCKRRVRFDHAGSLLANLDGGVDEHDIAPSDFDLIAVGIGPGSFTGLRIGLSLAKSLARSHDIPLVGVSSLACLTHPHAVVSPADYVVGAYDARRREVYTATHRYDDELETVDEDRLASPDELRSRIEALADRGRRVTVVGNGADTFEPLRTFDRDDVDVLPPWTQGPSGVSAALLGRTKYRREGADEIRALEPNYIRPSSAEEDYRAEDESPDGDG